MTICLAVHRLAGARPLRAILLQARRIEIAKECTRKLRKLLSGKGIVTSIVGILIFRSAWRFEDLIVERSRDIWSISN